MTKTVTVAATAVAAGMGVAACGGSTSGAHSAARFAAHTRTRPAQTAAAAADMASRAAVRQVSRAETRPTVTSRVVTGSTAIAFDTVRKTDPALTAGTRLLQQSGVAGVQSVTYRQKVVGHVVAGATVVKRVTTRQPVDRIVLVGTKRVTPLPVTPSTGGLDLSRAAMWDRIAQCESTSNWSIDTGNGYYGGLQFDLRTWLGAGGGRFAARPDLASRAQQITIANHVYASRGLSPWSCAYAA